MANGYCSTYSCPESESWEQRASELLLVSVDEGSLVLGDAVKGQNPCMLVQVDADPFGLWCTQQFFLVIVPKGKSAPRPVQTPRQLIVAQTALVIITLAFYFFVGNSDGDLHDGSEENKFSEGHKCKSRLLITLKNKKQKGKQQNFKLQIETIR